MSNGSLVSLWYKHTAFVRQKKSISEFTNLFPVSKLASVSMSVSLLSGLSWEIILALLLSTTFAAALKRGDCGRQRNALSDFKQGAVD